MADAAPRPRLGTAAFATLFAVMSLTAAGNTGLISVMPAIGREIRIPDFLVASIFSLSAGLWALSSPYWARLSDRHGRKPFIIIGMLGFGVSMTGCGLVVLAGLDRLAAPLVIFAGFFVVRSSYGLLGSATSTAAQAYVADNSDGARRVRSLTTLAGALNLGTILGPAVAPFLVLAPLTLAGPMFVFAAVGFVTVLAALIAIPRDRPQVVAGPASAGVTFSSVWRDPAIRPHLTYAFVIASAQAINTYTLGFLIIDRLARPPAEAQASIGLAMVAGAVAGLVAQWGLVGVGRMGPRQMLRWGAAAAVAGNLIIALGSGFTSLLLAFALANLGYGLGRPGAAAGASLAAPPAAQGAVAGAISSIAGASIAIPPVLAVALYQWLPAAPFVLVSLMSALLLFYSLANRSLSAAAIVSGER